MPSRSRSWAEPSVWTRISSMQAWNFLSELQDVHTSGSARARLGIWAELRAEPVWNTPLCFWYLRDMRVDFSPTLVAVYSLRISVMRHYFLSMMVLSVAWEPQLESAIQKWRGLPTGPSFCPVYQAAWMLRSNCIYAALETRCNLVVVMRATWLKNQVDLSKDM